MSIALLVMTDGRDEYLDRAMDSARETLAGQVDEWWMHDDTGADAYRLELSARHPEFAVFGGSKRLGFGGAIANAWRRLARQSRADWIFHLEADFVFRRPVDLAAMAEVLAASPHLAQMALRRQPWNAAETAAGGVVEQHPGDYTEVRDGAGRVWLEHRRFVTTNPCLYRRQLCEVGWPSGAHSEGHFGIGLFRDGLPWGVPGPSVRSAFWGARDSGEWVEHIGNQRAGTGY